MRTSADNQFHGRISQVEVGAVNTEVTLDVSPEVKLVSIITNLSASRLELHIDKNACALIKASDPIIFIESTPESYSARNILWGSVFAIEQGAVNCEVMIDLGNEQHLSVIVTNTSALKLALVAGMRIGALIKAPQVMLATIPENN